MRMIFYFLLILSSFFID